MADPLSITTSVVALAGFVFQASKSLYSTIDSFQSNTKVIRELKQEVTGLEEALSALQEVGRTYEQQLKSLELPLRQCGKACEDFNRLLEDCTKHSGGSRTSFRDWAKVQYMGGNITKFKDMLAGYKATIGIALAGATFRTVSITANVLEEYKELVQNAHSDLEDHLNDLNTKLEQYSSKQSDTGNISIEERRIKDEKESAEQCLQICEKVAEYIDRLGPRLKPLGDVPAISEQDYSTIFSLNSNSPIDRTLSTLLECKERLLSQSTALKRRLAELEGKLKVFSNNPHRLSMTPEEELNRMREEKDSIVQCLAICDDASQVVRNRHPNIVEDITSADESSQVVVSTIGELILARRVTTGSKSSQWFGQMSDETIQTLARNRGNISEGTSKPSTENTESFRKRFGTGRNLS